MLSNFLKHLGIGLAAAVVGAAAGYFAAPEHYAQLGAFAGLAAIVGAAIADALRKLASKLSA